jgi:hypothetical protein
VVCLLVGVCRLSLQLNLAPGRLQTLAFRPPLLSLRGGTFGVSLGLSCGLLVLAIHARLELGPLAILLDLSLALLARHLVGQALAFDFRLNLLPAELGLVLLAGRLCLVAACPHFGFRARLLEPALALQVLVPGDGPDGLLGLAGQRAEEAAGCSL